MKTKKRNPLITNSNLDKILFCVNCGSANLQVRAWVDINTNAYCSDIDDGDVWCEDCEDLTQTATLPELWDKFQKENDIHIR